MSHLGELLSALVDGELSGTQLDRANAHLATCGACRVEAGALRKLKHELRGLREVSDPGEIADRLLALTGTHGPAAEAPLGHPRRKRGGGRRRGRFHAARLRDPRGTRDTAAPYCAVPREKRAGRRRGRYVLWTTVSLVVVGIGTAAFGMGGGGTQEPNVTPQLEVFNLQQAVTSGDVPFADPAETSTILPADISARVPVVAARP